MTVTYPKGFSAAGIAAGIRHGDGPDVALVVNNGPRYQAALVTTSNRFAAAPVHLSRRHVANNQAKAVILNAGCANACTGDQGVDDATTMATTTAGLLGCAAEDVVVCSTGMIGENLPMDKVTAGIKAAYQALSDSDEAGYDAADAILTTDTHSKTVELESEDGSWRIGAMIKGAGMLAPGMATMLCVITTDAVISGADLQHALEHVNATTLNRVDSDGCMSTNDTVTLLSSGASGVAVSVEDFSDGLHEVMSLLAQLLVQDAEGVNHTVAITVADADSEDGAQQAARAISRSNLVKCAIFGNDPNWGRIVSELGAVPKDVVAFDPAKVSVSINDVCVFANGTQATDRSAVSMDDQHVTIDVNVGSGTHSATVLTNDLTHDYVHINSDYSS